MGKILAKLSEGGIIRQQPIVWHRRKPAAGHLQEMKLLVLFKAIRQRVALKIQSEQIPCLNPLGIALAFFDIQKPCPRIPQQLEFMHGKITGKRIPRLDQLRWRTPARLPANGLDGKAKHRARIAWLLKPHLELQTRPFLAPDPQQMALDILILAAFEILRELFAHLDGNQAGQVG